MVYKQRLFVLHFKNAARIGADGFFGRREDGFFGHGEATNVFFGRGVNHFFGGDSIKRLEDLMENSSMEQEDRDTFPKFEIVVSGINQCIISSWFWVPKCLETSNLGLVNRQGRRQRSNRTSAKVTWHSVDSPF